MKPLLFRSGRKLGIPVFLLVLFGQAMGAQAQQAPEVAVRAERIVADPQMRARERIERSIMLLESRAEIERSRGTPGVAEKLERAAALLRVAPHTGEAGQLAAEAVVAAEQGAITDVLVLAGSAAALSPGWTPGE